MKLIQLKIFFQYLSYQFVSMYYQFSPDTPKGCLLLPYLFILHWLKCWMLLWKMPLNVVAGECSILHAIFVASDFYVPVAKWSMKAVVHNIARCSQPFTLGKGLLNRCCTLEYIDTHVLDNLFQMMSHDSYHLLAFVKYGPIS